MSPSAEAAEARRIWRVFHAVDDDGDGFVEPRDLARLIERAGFAAGDGRSAGLLSRLEVHGEAPLDFIAFLALLGADNVLVEQIAQGDLALPDFAAFTDQLGAIFAETALDRGGEPARYVAPLAEVDPDHFGVAVVTIDGQVTRLGDAEVDFSIQSICKPLNYAFALDERERDIAGARAEVHRYVGMEPSGVRYDAATLMTDGTRRPPNPMINTGALVTATLIQPTEPSDRRLAHVRRRWARLIDGPLPRIDTRLHAAEIAAGDRHRALMQMLAEVDALPPSATSPKGMEDTLSLYFGTCALALTATEVATAAATLANGGVCPASRERVLSRRTVRDCLSMMQMCGMYDGSGEFCLRIGLPAKSGVGGGVLLVVPGLMGLCVWSPRLDARGNSVRGFGVAERLTTRYRLHLYDPPTTSAERPDPRLSIARWRAEQTAHALWAARCGDTRALHRLRDRHVDLGRGDYDKRTPLHLAAAHGHVDVLRMLIDDDVDPDPLDRWQRRPLDDAEAAGHRDATATLRAAGARRGSGMPVRRSTARSRRASQFTDDVTITELLWAAASDDVDHLRRLVARGVPVDAPDYDGRTALHLAAGEGALDALRYLLAHGHPLDPHDAWGATPLDDARRGAHGDAVALLTAASRDHRGS